VHFASALPAAGEPAYPTRLGIAIRLVIAFGSPVEPIADAVRASVRRRVPRLTGAEITTVDILVMDITGPGP
jgi:uncharacterized alkaline shock family protein YloU